MESDLQVCLRTTKAESEATGFIAVEGYVSQQHEMPRVTPKRFSISFKLRKSLVFKSLRDIGSV